MPFSYTLQQRLVNLLYTRREVPLVDVLAVFSAGDDQSEVEAVRHAIGELSAGEAIQIRYLPDGNLGWFNDACLLRPHQYTLILNSPGEIEVAAVAGREQQLVPAGWDGAEPGEQYVYVENPIALRVVGDLDGAAALAERVRAFAHYFACQLLARRFSGVESLFCQSVRTKNAANTLEKRLLDLEQAYGSLQFCDRIELQTVYCGRGAAQKLFTEMKLPDGVEREVRRGEAVIHLASVHTPNGVAMVTCPLYLAIIEEDGVFRVCESQWGDSTD